MLGVLGPCGEHLPPKARGVAVAREESGAKDPLKAGDLGPKSALVARGAGPEALGPASDALRPPAGFRSQIMATRGRL